ncbi:MAG: glycosyltransferase family 9 protein [Candidatus Coatesbacteria bacterium]|nr:glycosyltransferase family 9 protein [Candidatus Coatesbacteria bacterium]
MPETRKILVVRTDSLGDCLLTLPMFYSIKKQKPDYELGILCSRTGLPVFERQPFVSHIHLYPACSKTDNEIREIGYDEAIIVHPEIKLARYIWQIGIKRRIGTARRLYSMLFTDRINVSRRNSDIPEWQHNLNMLEAIDLKPLKEPIKLYPDDSEYKQAEYLINGRQDGKKTIGIHAGSKGSALNWSEDNYFSLAETLAGEGMNVILTGTSEEEKLFKGKIRNSKIISLFGKTTFFQFAALCTFLDLFISGSTGVMHVASTMGTRTLTFFPPFLSCSSKRWGPFDASRSHFLVPDIVCPSGKCSSKCKYHNCLDAFNPSEVMKTILNILKD